MRRPITVDVILISKSGECRGSRPCVPHGKCTRLVCRDPSTHTNTRLCCRALVRLETPQARQNYEVTVNIKGVTRRPQVPNQQKTPYPNTLSFSDKAIKSPLELRNRSVINSEALFDIQFWNHAIEKCWLCDRERYCSLCLRRLRLLRQWDISLLVWRYLSWLRTRKSMFPDSEKKLTIIENTPKGGSSMPDLELMEVIVDYNLARTNQ